MMGRRRKHRKDLPERVYHKHSSYYFIQKDGTWLNLGKDYIAAMTRYATINNVGTLNSLGAVMDAFIVSEIPKKALRTQHEYLQQMKRLRQVFGHMQPHEIQPKDIYGYMDLRPAIAANREKSLLSALFSFAIRKGVCADNPCRLVKRNTERPRDRYVQDWEFNAVRSMAPPALQCAMDIARRTGLRESDILRAGLRNVRDDGLHVHTSKTGKKMIYELTPQLLDAIARARSLGSNAKSKVRALTLIVNRTGGSYTSSGFSSVWQKVMNKAMKDGVIAERYTFNDLRAKAGSESTNAQELLGHDDPRTTNRVYRRLPRRVRPVDHT